MAITYSATYVHGTTNTTASASITVAVNDVVTILYSCDDNAAAGTLSCSKTAGTSTVSAFTNIATTNTNDHCKSAAWYCVVTGAGTLTVTVTNTSSTRNQLGTIVHTGANTTDPCPSAKRYSGIDADGDTTQSITPTASGSALWMILGDYNARNTFAAAANCTLADTWHQASRATFTIVRPTTQPRTDANAFTIGESDTGCDNAWVAFEVKEGTSSQTLTQSSRFDNTNTFYAPTVSPGAVGLTPSLFINSNTFYGPTVSHQLPQASRFDNSNTFYAPTVTVGAVDLTPARFDNTHTFYAPTVTVGAVDLTPDLFTNSNTFYEATITLSVTASLFTNSNTFYGPTVSHVLPQASRFDNTNIFYGHVLEGGELIIAPSLFTNDNTFYAPTVSFELLPARFDNDNTFYAHTIVSGAILTPDRFDNTNIFYGPTVSQGLPQASRFDNTNTFYSPTVSLTVLPSLFTNDNTFYGPTVTAGAVDVSPNRLDNANIFYSATVSPGAVNLAPSLFTNSNAFYGPTVTLGAVTLFPTLFTNSNTFYAPTVAVGAVNLAPARFDNASIFYAHDLNAPAIDQALRFDNASIFYAHTIVAIEAEGKLKLFNAALRHLGDNELSTVSENRESRRIMDDVFADGFIVDLLEQAPWKFAARTVLLLSDASLDSQFGYRCVTLKPDDWVHSTKICVDEWLKNPLLEYADEGNCLYSDSPEIYVQYISNGLDYGNNFDNWPRPFAKYAELYLAVHVAERLTQAAGKFEVLHNLMMKARTDAKASNAMEGPTQFFPGGGWATSRRGMKQTDRGSRSKLMG